MNNLTIPGQLNMTYAYPAGTNNGKISSQTDNISGETVTYAYDSLNRLLSASGTGWNQSFGYDGFGNLVSKSGLNSPPLSLAVDPATNRAIITNVQYDANGNPNAYNGTPLLYDAENHVFSAVGLTDYLYDSQGKRIWKGSFSGGSLVGQEVYFYGVDGQKLGTYTLYLNYGTGQPLYLADPNASLAVFFGGKRVAVNGAPFVPDRLGSNTAGKYFPYGEDRGTPAANDQVKFGTYTRDSATGLDYADQRYYSNQFGRFMTPDRYTASARPNDPGRWNSYTYALSDPINGYDPTGSETCFLDTPGCAPPPSFSCFVDPFAPAPLSPECYDPGPSPDEPPLPLPECEIKLLTQKIKPVGVATPFNHTSVEVDVSGPAGSYTVHIDGIPVNGYLTARYSDSAFYKDTPQSVVWSSGVSLENCIRAFGLLGAAGTFPNDKYLYDLVGQNSNSLSHALLVTKTKILPWPIDLAEGLNLFTPGWWWSLSW